jgi:hypothetical protein
MFLHKRKIHDALVLAQEAMHSIKSKKLSIIIMKLDLSKAYDKVSRVFLRISLIQPGMNLATINWKMGCIESSSFSILINGSPSPFFFSSSGIRKGYPLSPFIFLIVAEGLRNIIANARKRALLKGMKIYPTEFLTHFIFVDDAMIFGTGSM